jgi:hypothetical protein
LSLKDLLREQPWRSGLGTPKNALDPRWTPAIPTDFCGGEIHWETETGWWFCASCSYIGSGSLVRHRPVLDPAGFCAESQRFFLEQRAKQGVGVEDAVNQINYLVGAFLRKMATTHPEDVEGELRKIFGL